MAAKKSLSNILVWILMAMLIMGLAGFGITNLSGYRSTVAQVGEIDISMDEYAHSLQREIRAAEAVRSAPLTFADARKMGLDQQVMARLISTALLDDETQQLGISIGDATLAREIETMQAFQGPTGSFDREIYANALQNAGIKEAQFETQLRRDSSRSLLQAAVGTGIQIPDITVQTIVDFAAQTRNVTWAMIDGAEIDAPEPTEADLQTYYEAHPEAYTTPETRKISYVWLTPDMIVDTVEVDEKMLREAYEKNADSYNTPERRLVERLVFPDAAAADAARATIDAGGSFEDAVAARGLALEDIDLGDVAEPELDQAGAAVFAAQTGEVVGPVETSLGPALFRVNAILAAKETSFEDAEPELRDELAIDRARRVIESKVDGVDDELAAGATLEDIARDTDLKSGTVEWTPDMSEGIAGYEEFRTAAAAATADDYPEIKQLADGGIFALRLDEIIPPTLKPLDAVRNEVSAAWADQTLTDALRTRGDELVAKLEAGQSFAGLGLTTETADNVTRGDPIADEIDGATDVLFGLDETGAYGVAASTGRAAILRLDGITKPDATEPDVETMASSLKDQFSESYAQDLFQALANDLRTRTEISVDEAAINAVNSSSFR